jgi:hypothetical protein
MQHAERDGVGSLLQGAPGQRGGRPIGSILERHRERIAASPNFLLAESITH